MVPSGLFVNECNPTQHLHYLELIYITFYVSYWPFIAIEKIENISQSNKNKYILLTKVKITYLGYASIKKFSCMYLFLSVNMAPPHRLICFLRLVVTAYPQFNFKRDLYGCKMLHLNDIIWCLSHTYTDIEKMNLHDVLQILKRVGSMNECLLLNDLTGTRR